MRFIYNRFVNNLVCCQMIDGLVIDDALHILQTSRFIPTSALKIPSLSLTTNRFTGEINAFSHTIKAKLIFSHFSYNGYIGYFILCDVQGLSLC